MKIRIIVELDERMRRAINHRTGRDYPASYDEAKQHLDAIITADFESICSEWDQSEEAEELLIKAGVLEPNYGPNDTRRRE